MKYDDGFEPWIDPYYFIIVFGIIAFIYSMIALAYVVKFFKFVAALFS